MQKENLSLRVLVLDDNLKSAAGVIKRSLTQFLSRVAEVPDLGQLEGRESKPINLMGFLEVPVEFKLMANRISERAAVDVKQSIEEGKFHGNFDIIFLDDKWIDNEFGGQDVLLREVYNHLEGVSEEFPLICLFTEHWNDDRLQRFYKLIHDEYRSWSRILPCNKNDPIQILHIFYRAISEKNLFLQREAEKERADNISNRARVYGLDLDRQLPEEESFCGIVGSSLQMRQVYDLIRKVGPKNATVLLRGETGTGKELVAHALHRMSERKGHPFVPVNCAAIPEELIESELFGHLKGAFTGATEKKSGKFEQADGGTIFLDEVGDMSLKTQAKVLRVLQESEVQKIGSSKIRKLNVRVIAATNKNLEVLMKEESFREDLFFRLKGFPIHLPLLRERKDDISLLIRHFIRKSKEKEKRLSKEAFDCFMTYDWPGNVRELKDSIERALIISNSTEIILNDLPWEVKNPKTSSSNSIHVHPDGLVKGKFPSDEKQWKAYNYLNKYEDACRKIIGKPKITQEKIAEVLGVSHSAISQIIGEYSKEILALLDANPNAWPNLTGKTRISVWCIRAK